MSPVIRVLARGREAEVSVDGVEAGPGLLRRSRGRHDSRSEMVAFAEAFRAREAAGCVLRGAGSEDDRCGDLP